MRKTRLILFVNLFILIFFGLVMIYSSSCIYAQNVYNDGMYFLKRHIIFICLGILLMFLAMSFDYRHLQGKTKLIVLFAIFLLVLVFFVGKEAGGARRWFRIGYFNFQPSEFAHLALILYVADFISQKKMLIKESFLKGILPVLLVLGAISGLILLQPDLGTAVAMGIIVLLMLFVAAAPMRYLLFIFLVSLISFYILIFSSPYRKARILAFLNPWQDPRKSGFQIIQSQVALGSGGVFGRGLGHSRQKLFYLPASHTDFIFSIIGEELGLVGTLSVVFLFLNLIIQGFKIGRYAQDTFGIFLSLGIVLLIGLKAGINMGVSIGVLPTKGLPLPFISYGGSSFIFDMIGMGLLFNVSRFSEEI